MRYSSEPVPSATEPALADYLDRQFNALANASDAAFIVPTLSVLPQRAIPGGVVYVKDDGLYACINEVADGDATWKKLATTP